MAAHTAAMPARGEALQATLDVGGGGGMDELHDGNSFDTVWLLGSRRILTVISCAHMKTP